MHPEFCLYMQLVILDCCCFQVTVTNTGDGCVTYFPGTSSAAPIAAGILALVLEVM